MFRKSSTEPVNWDSRFIISVTLEMMEGTRRASAAVMIAMIIKAHAAVEMARAREPGSFRVLP